MQIDEKQIDMQKGRPHCCAKIYIIIKWTRFARCSHFYNHVHPLHTTMSSSAILHHFRTLVNQSPFLPIESYRDKSGLLIGSRAPSGIRERTDAAPTATCPQTKHVVVLSRRITK